MSQQVIHRVFKPPKPWLSYKAQLAQLRERGLQVEDEAAALNYLARLGYYRLSGYWYPMREVDQHASAQQGKAVRSDGFVPGSHFQSVVQFGRGLPANGAGRIGAVRFWLVPWLEG